MTNQEFCYWLQGYFEIAKIKTLTKEQVLLINGSLKKINEPLGYFTTWLADILSFVISKQYHQGLMSFLLVEIINRLNTVFDHVIDNNPL